jgi:hypothetical protein
MNLAVALSRALRKPQPGAATVRVSELAQTLFWCWATMAGLALFVAWWIHRRGWWTALVDGDPSGISLAIVLLAVVVTAWCGRRAWHLTLQAREGAPWRREYAREQQAHNPQAAPLLAERTHGPHETAWWFAAAALKLGLLGTVVGFMVMAAQIGQAASFDTEQIQGLLKQMTSGMAIALYTTLVGLVANLWLGVQLLLLDRLADHLGADIVRSAQEA